jgi:hypothetical protein
MAGFGQTEGRIPGGVVFAYFSDSMDQVALIALGAIGASACHGDSEIGNAGHQKGGWR